MSAPVYDILGRFVPKTNGTVGSSLTPPALALVTGELATNSFLGDLFSKKEDGSVALVGANAKQIVGRAVTSASPSDGQYLKWDATTGQFIYAPASVSGSASAPVLTTLVGNGTQTLFPINGYTNNERTNYLVSINNVLQKPDSSTYSISASGIQLSSAPANGATGFVLAFQAPVVSSALGDTTAEEVDRAFRGSDTGVLAIGNTNYYSLTNTDATVTGCPVTVVSDSIIRVSGFVPYTTVSVKRTAGSNILTSTLGIGALAQQARPGHLITGTGIPDGTTIVSVSSSQIVMSLPATSTQTTHFTATIKAGTSIGATSSVNVGFPLALTGFINGVFAISATYSSGVNIGSVDVVCRSNATVGTTGQVDVQSCSVRSIAIGFGAGVLSAEDAIQVGIASSSVEPLNVANNYKRKQLVAVGNESKSATRGVAIGSSSSAHTTNAVAIGYNANAGDDFRDYLPYDTLICSAGIGSNVLLVVCGRTQGMSVGMLVTGTGIPANATVTNIDSSNSVSFTISANVTSTLTASTVSLAYPTLASATASVVSGSNVVKLNDALVAEVGQYVIASQFPAGTRVVYTDSAFDGTDYFQILMLSRAATATSTTATLSFKAEGRFRKILTGASIAANSHTCTVSSTAGVSVGDIYTVWSADGTISHGYGRVARILSATSFYGTFWNLQSALSGKLVEIEKSSNSSAVAIGAYASAATGELGLCDLNVQATSGTANAAYMPVNVGGIEYVVPLNLRS